MQFFLAAGMTAVPSIHTTVRLARSLHCLLSIYLRNSRVKSNGQHLECTSKILSILNLLFPPRYAVEFQNMKDAQFTKKIECEEHQDYDLWTDMDASAAWSGGDI